MSGRILPLSAIALAVVIGGAIAVGIATTRGPDPVASLDDLRQREVMFLDEERVFLVYNDGDPLALSDDAQHVGDRVEFCESSQMFESPAHGEKFDFRGNYFGGPAERGLDRYPVRIDGDRIFVELGQRVQGPRRYKEATLDPQGPFCFQ